MFKFRILAGALLLLAASSTVAQKNEIAFLGGTNFTSSKDFSVLTAVPCTQGTNCQTGALSFGHNVAFQGTYARKFFSSPLLSLSLEVPVVGATSISVKTSNTAVLPPNNYSALYFTPGLRLTAFSLAGISPWVSVGGGLARFGPNGHLVDGTVNPNSNAANAGAIQFGGGVDLKFLPYLALRGEVRDFYSAIPVLNTGSTTDRAHNVIVSGGLVFHF